MNINQATIDLVKEFEGLELKAYRDPVGVLTIGYGYTNHAGYGPGVKVGDVWTEAMAEEMLITGLRKFADQIIPHFTRKPTENQFGAMLSLAYNIGPGAFRKSTCLRRFNAGDIKGAAEALTWFNKAGGRVLRGLVRRREAERALFLSGSAAPVNTGSDVRPDPEKTVGTSTTMRAAAGQVVTAVGGSAASVGMLDDTAQIVALILFACIAAMALWIMRERLKKLVGGV
jgi:lysozyme